MAVLADPMRRMIFEMLAEGPRSVSDIAEQFASDSSRRCRNICVR